MSSALALVTGATGFIGRHLTRRLAQEGTPVVALVRAGSPSATIDERAMLRLPIEDWSAEGLRRSLSAHDFTVVYHLAAYGVRPTDRDLATMQRINVDLPVALVRCAAERGATVVATGSCAEYAPQQNGTRRLIDENAGLESMRLYGASKAAGGLMACAAATALRGRLRYLRLFNVFGPGEATHRLLPSLVRRLARNERVPLSEGLQTRDFVLVDDAVDALVAAGCMEGAGEAPAVIWNVCSGQGNTVREFAMHVAAAMGQSSDLLGFGELPLRPDDLAWLVGDPGSIAAGLGWRPRHAFADGILSAVSRIASDLDGSSHGQ